MHPKQQTWAKFEWNDRIFLHLKMSKLLAILFRRDVDK